MTTRTMAHDTRQRILDLFHTTPGAQLTTAKIAARVHITPNAVGYHLRALEANSTITRIRDGFRCHWVLNDEAAT